MSRARETILATGSSMFPFVPAGSVLTLRARGERLLELGDIVCYPATTGELVAHRVVAIEYPGDDAWLTTRGDANGLEDRIEVGAVAWIVERVEHRWLCYDTDGLTGRTFARVARRRGTLYRAARLAGRLAGTLLRRFDAGDSGHGS